MYMSARVLLNLLNELRKMDKTRGLPSILTLFRNKFNKFNNMQYRSTNVRFYLSYDIKTILKSHVDVKTLGFCHMLALKALFHNVSRKSVNH